MNSFEFNKIAMALLLTVLIMLGIGGLTGIIFEEDKLETNAFPIVVEVPEAKTAVAEQAAVEQEPVLADLLAVASVEGGVKIFKKCKACHTTANGGKNGVGPNLWNIVGRAKGGLEGYSYSDGMKAKGGNWTFEDLDTFLKKPKDFVTKTKMGFSGLKKAGDRAAVIAMLRSLSDAPVDLPGAAATEAVTEE